MRATFPPFAQEVLLEAEVLEVVAFEQGRSPMPDEREVHGAPVRASAIVRDRKERVELLTRLYQSVEEDAHPAECFNPHHWILARRGERRVEVLICFECSQLVVHLDGRSQGLQPMSHAAASVIGALVGNPSPRLFGGRTSEEWLEEVRRGLADREDGGDGSIDPQGVAVIAASANWSYFHEAIKYVDVFARLGEQAAPAAPSLARALVLVRADLADRLARVIASLGSSAAPAVPALVSILRDGEVPIDRRNHALRILAAIGPAARDALPALEPLRDHPILSAATRAAHAAIAQEEATSGAMGSSPGVAPTSSADARVKETFSPTVQELLLHGRLVATLVACERGPSPHEETLSSGLPIVDRVALTEPSARAGLVTAIYEGVANAPPSSDGCFTPHHALVAYGEEHRAEVVICFQCHAVEVRLDGKLVGKAATSSASERMFEALVGPVRDRPFDGHTIQEWRAELAATVEAQRSGPGPAVDRRGVRWLMESIHWSRAVDREGLRLLADLGTDAAPVFPDLRRLLENQRLSRPLREEALRSVVRLGPIVEGRPWTLDYLTYLGESSDLRQAARAALEAISAER